MGAASKLSLNAIVFVCLFALIGCGSIKSSAGAYSYMGRVVESMDETVTEQVSRPELVPMVVGPVVTAVPTGENVIVDRRSSYRRYKVALEQGEKITLRSRVSNIAAGSCVRVWIAGPGVSPTYWYDPDTSEIEMAQGCRAGTAQ
jgi:hypothetical protein